MEREVELRKEFEQLTEEDKKLVIDFVARLRGPQHNLAHDPCSRYSENHIRE